MQNSLWYPRWCWISIRGCATFTVLPLSTLGPMKLVDPAKNATMDHILASRPETMDRLEHESEHGKGGLTGNFIDVGMKSRPSPQDLPELGLEFLRVWPSVSTGTQPYGNAMACGLFQTDRYSYTRKRSIIHSRADRSTSVPQKRSRRQFCLN